MKKSVYKEPSLRINYKVDGGGIDKEIDKAIREAMADMGYNEYASGCDLCTGYRDISFDYSQIRETPA